MSQRYNGWENYETWAVKLWIDNDESAYHYWRGRARSEREVALVAGKQLGDATYALAQRLEREHDSHTGHPIFQAANGTVYSDLLQAALGNVNWYEIAVSLLDEDAEERAYEDRQDGSQS